jgi:hypothetical protein
LSIPSSANPQSGSSRSQSATNGLPTEIGGLDPRMEGAAFARRSIIKRRSALAGTSPFIGGFRRKPTLDRLVDDPQNTEKQAVSVEQAIIFAVSSVKVFSRGNVELLGAFCEVAPQRFSVVGKCVTVQRFANARKRIKFAELLARRCGQNVL